MEKIETNQKIENVDKESQPEKKRSLKVKISAWIIITFIALIIGSPFIGLGVLIGWWLWG